MLVCTCWFPNTVNLLLWLVLLILLRARNSIGFLISPLFPCICWSVVKHTHYPVCMYRSFANNGHAGIFEKLGRHRQDRSDLGQGQVRDCNEHGNKPSGSTKCGEFLDYVRTSKLLRRDSALWIYYYHHHHHHHHHQLLLVIYVSAQNKYLLCHVGVQLLEKLAPLGKFCHSQDYLRVQHSFDAQIQVSSFSPVEEVIYFTTALRVPATSRSESQ